MHQEVVRRFRLGKMGSLHLRLGALLVFFAFQLVLLGGRISVAGWIAAFMASLNQLFNALLSSPSFSSSSSSSVGRMGVPINQMVQITGGNPTFTESGNVLNLILTEAYASGFQSMEEGFLFYRMDVEMKLVPNNSAGTITSFYICSTFDSTRDEVDLEFLGNVSGEPITLQTNIFTKGRGDKEIMYRLWFDPTADFHTYSILWNPQFIIIYVDGLPIRVFPNLDTKGIAFPTHRPMRVYGSLFNGDQWATQGGRIKLNWSYAPFVASYKNFVVTPCPASSKNPSCYPHRPEINGVPRLDPETRLTLRETENKSVIYTYCTDFKRFPQGIGPECAYLNRI